MKRPDRTDVACEEWARAVRNWLEPKLGKDQVGALRCTLAARRDLHHGGRTERAEQHWPEFPYVGQAAMVNTVYKGLDEPLQEVLVAHYVVMTPRSKTIRADLMGLSIRMYWERVGRAKEAINGALLIIESVRTVSGFGSGISGTQTTYR